MLKNCRKMLKNCWKKLEILMKKDRKIAKKNVNLPNVRVRVRSATTSNWVCAHVCVRTLIWTCEVRACDPKKGRNSHLELYTINFVSFCVSKSQIILFSFGYSFANTSQCDFVLFWADTNGWICCHDTVESFQLW